MLQRLPVFALLGAICSFAITGAQANGTIEPGLVSSAASANGGGGIVSRGPAADGSLIQAPAAPAAAPTPISIVMDGDRVISGSAAPGGQQPQGQISAPNVWNLSPSRLLPSYPMAGGGGGGEYPYRNNSNNRMRAFDSTTGTDAPPDTSQFLNLTPLVTQAQTAMQTYMGQILPIIGTIVVLVLGISVVMLIVNSFRKG